MIRRLHVRRTIVLCATLAMLVVLLFVPGAAARSEVVPARVVHVVAHGDDVVRAKDAPVHLEGGLLAYPAHGRTETVVYLHGVRGRAENGCPIMREGARSLGALVCPEPPVVAGPGFSWSSSSSENDAVVRSAEDAAGGDPTVLVGFSQGSYVALDVAQRHPGKYRGLVLLAAEIDATKRDLGGASRVVLAAGALDPSFEPMQRAARKLRAEGVDVRFVSLGRVGHTYVGEDADRRAAFADALAWAGRT